MTAPDTSRDLSERDLGAAPEPVLRAVAHTRRAMVGRDAYEHRAATPLELLYDLVFVISLGVAAGEFAHLLAVGATWTAIGAFGFSMFGVIWAWINFSWFASAFDNDDWLYRLNVLVQMAGVIVLSFGLERFFETAHDHEAIDLSMVIIGYVIMRVPLIFLWLRVARSDPDHRQNALWYAGSLAVAQVLWCVLAFVHLTFGVFVVVVAPLFLIELAVPVVSERFGEGTPWNIHHIAERYGLMAIITFGEVLIGAVQALGALVSSAGWSGEVLVDAIAAVALTFGLWWTYFNVPFAGAIRRARRKAFGFGYSHLIVFAAISAIGSGLHVVALYLEGEATIDRTAVMATVAIPIGVYLTALTALSEYLTDETRIAWLVLAAQLALCGLGVVVVASGATLMTGILMTLAASWLAVIVQEIRGASLG